MSSPSFSHSLPEPGVSPLPNPLTSIGPAPELRGPSKLRIVHTLESSDLSGSQTKELSKIVEEKNTEQTLQEGELLNYSLGKTQPTTAETAKHQDVTNTRMEQRKTESEQQQRNFDKLQQQFEEQQKQQQLNLDRLVQQYQEQQKQQATLDRMEQQYQHQEVSFFCFFLLFLSN